MEKENIIDLRRFSRSVKRLWWLYLVSSLCMLCGAFWVVSRMLPKVPIGGEMLVGEDSLSDGGAGLLSSAGKGAGGIGQIMKTFSVGGVGA